MRKTVARWLAVLLLVLGLPAAAAEPWDALREGGVVILLRHARTDAGVGDPPGFRLGDCSTQRNLSPQGREQALRLGRLLAAGGVKPVAVFSSAWCRCIDTARLAFPGLSVGHLAALDSLFGDASRSAAAPGALRDALARVSDKGVTVWVTHQVNASALTGEALRMGEALVLRRKDGDFTVVGRLSAPDS